MNSKFLSLLVLFSFIMVVPIFAQEDWEATGEIEDSQVVIEKDRNIQLPNAGRIFERVPAFAHPTGSMGLNYSFERINYRPGVLRTAVRPLTVKSDPLSKVRNNNVRLGYGNFGTPYLWANLGSGRNDEFLYNLSLLHRSSQTGPVGDEISGDGINNISLMGTMFLNKATLTGLLEYDRQNFSWYGYDPDDDAFNTINPGEDFDKQVLNAFDFGVKLESNNPSGSGSYKLDLGLGLINDLYEASETDFEMDFTTGFTLNEDLDINLQADVAIISRRDENIASLNRNLFRIKPFGRYKLENLSFDVGLSAVIENDTIGEKDFHLFPFVNIDYQVGSSAKAYLGFQGDVKKRTLKDLFTENRYLNANAEVYHETRGIDFYAGLDGNLSGKWSYALRANLMYFKNRGYFINAQDPDLDSTRFDVIYDRGTGNQNHFKAALGYNLNNMAYLGVQNDFYIYTTDQIAEAWHLPQNIFKLVGSYILAEKLKFTVDTYMMSGIKALTPTTQETVTLESFVDLGVGLEYLLSKQGSIFVNAYNVLGDEYQRYLNYPNRSLQVIGGISFSF